METPYGSIPDRLVKDMTPQEMNDFLAKKYRRRSLLTGAAALAAAAAGPLFWRQSAASAATLPTGPQWIAFGHDPKSQMFVSWSVGSASATGHTPPRPMVRWGLDTSYGRLASGCLRCGLSGVLGGFGSMARPCTGGFVTR